MFLNSKCECQRKKECGISSCLYGYKPKENECGCEKEFWNSSPCEISKCFDGFKINSDCQCVKLNLPVCRKLCPKGQTIYPGKCSCEKKRTCHIEECSSPAYLNDNCECELPQDYCDITCEPGTYWQFPCQCVGNPFDNDSDFFVVDPLPIDPLPVDPLPVDPLPVDPLPIDNLNCQIEECKPGLKLNEENCSCVESNLPTCRIGCPFGRRVYPGLCDCIKPYECRIQSCKSPAIVNYNCECELPQDYCDISCPPGTEFEFPCQCVNIQTDEGNSNGKCQISECKPAFKINQDKCECELENPNGPICFMLCPENMIMYPGTCNCVKPYRCKIEKCNDGLQISPDCKCVE